MLLMSEIQNSRRIQSVAACCNTSDEFFSLVNSACRRYLRRGDFMGSVEDIFVCVTQGCVVMPRYVGKVRKINVCNQAIEVQNGWWRFMRSNQVPMHWQQWWGQGCNLQDRGQTAVFQDIMGDGRYIRAYPRCQADVGKTLQFFGTDNNGQALVTQNPDGSYSDGITLTLAFPFASSSVPVRKVDYVIKEVTQLPVDCYAYNASADVLEELAHYDAGETKPMYARYHLGIHWPNCGTGSIQPNCCATKRGVLVRTKLAMIDARVPTDILPLDNLEAVEMMIQSIKAQEAGDFAVSKQWEAAAVKEGNLEINDAVPDDQFAAANNVLGARVWNNQCF